MPNDMSPLGIPSLAARSSRKPGLLLPLIAATWLTIATPGSALPPGSVDVASADNGFGFHLLNAVQKATPGGNVVLSPVSAALDLSMVVNGADGKTQQEILTALSLDGAELDAINMANAQLLKVLRAPSQSVTLSVADSLWVDSRRATLRPDYVQQMRASYDAEVADLDFGHSSSLARINGWAAKETHDKIPKIIDRIDPADVLLLLNAVYFKGQWKHPFDKAQTQERDFALADGTSKKVARMAQSGRFDYFETPDVQAIRLPFGDGDLVMQVLLPAKSSSLEALETELTPELWAVWKSHYVPRQGSIELPRFELKSHYRLNAPLQTLGMRSAFDSHAAELTRMFTPPGERARSKPFFISQVLQSTYWKVDEEGSEAAAVTSIGVRAAALTRPEKPFQMVVDRPYLCTIEDRRSGVLLFVGAIYDPTG
jgi:serine protease inhibitor